MTSGHMSQPTSAGDLLLCLYGLVLSHIVPGDVAFSHGVQTTSLPPVTILEGGGEGRGREGCGVECGVQYGGVGNSIPQ